MVLFFLILSASFSQAQIIKWNNGGGDSLWGTAANWSNNPLPTSTTTLTFDSTFVRTDQTISLGNTTRAIGTLTFSSALNYTLNNGTNRFQGSTAGTNFTQSGAGTVALGAATRTVTVDNTGTTTFSGLVSGTGGLTKSGTGTLTLSGASANTYTGATFGTRGTAPTNQITFTGFSANSTTWQSYDKQITPVPEPATYGALLLAFATAFACWRRHRSTLA